MSMKAYDIEISAAQLVKASEWVLDGNGDAPVQLAVDDSMLIVGQGDAKTAFDSDGSAGSDEYIALAPLDPVGAGRHPLGHLSPEQVEALFQLAATGAEQLDYDIHDHWGQYKDDPASQASAQSTLDIYNTIRRTA